MVVIPAVGVRISMAAIIIAAPHVRVAATIVSVLGESAAMSVANYPSAVASPRLESPLAMSTVVDGHAAFGVDGANVATAIEIRFRATLGFDAGALSGRVEIVGASIRPSLRGPAGRMTAALCCRVGRPGLSPSGRPRFGPGGCTSLSSARRPSLGAGRCSGLSSARRPSFGTGRCAGLGAGSRPGFGSGCCAGSGSSCCAGLGAARGARPGPGRCTCLGPAGRARVLRGGGRLRRRPRRRRWLGSSRRLAWCRWSGWLLLSYRSTYRYCEENRGN